MALVNSATASSIILISCWVFQCVLAAKSAFVTLVTREAVNWCPSLGVTCCARLTTSCNWSLFTRVLLLLSHCSFQCVLEPLRLLLLSPFLSLRLLQPLELLLAIVFCFFCKLVSFFRLSSSGLSDLLFWFPYQRRRVVLLIVQLLHAMF